MINENYQGRGFCQYLPKPQPEADNTNRGFVILRIQYLNRFIMHTPEY